MMGRHAESIGQQIEQQEGVVGRVPGADIAAELMRAAFAGDQETFDRLFDAWFAVLYAEAWRATRDPKRAAERAREMVIERIEAAAERPLRPPGPARAG
jgi:hypothetical protein